jgi:hypothetical protein
MRQPDPRAAAGQNLRERYRPSSRGAPDETGGAEERGFHRVEGMFSPNRHGGKGAWPIVWIHSLAAQLSFTTLAAGLTRRAANAGIAHCHFSARALFIVIH